MLAHRRSQNQTLAQLNRDHSKMLFVGGVFSITDPRYFDLVASGRTLIAFQQKLEKAIKWMSVAV